MAARPLDTSKLQRGAKVHTFPLSTDPVSSSASRSDFIFLFVTLCLLLCAPSFTSQPQSLLSNKPRSFKLPTTTTNSFQVSPRFAVRSYLRRSNSRQPFRITMFFNKSTVALAFVALANLVSAGQTPACLLSVIGYVVLVDIGAIALSIAVAPRPNIPIAFWNR